MSRFDFKSWIICLPILFFSFSLLACSEDDIPPQSAQELFLSPHLPKQLDIIANPHLNSNKDQTHSKETLPVAVIDDGVDYLHPRLIDRIFYQRNSNGERVGAGFDLMNRDVWAHPNLIDADSFAFGAKAIAENGAILEPLPDPLAHIDELNNVFMDRFIDNLKKHKELKKTLFNQLDKNSFSLFTAYFLYSFVKSPNYKNFLEEIKKPAFLYLEQKSKKKILKQLSQTQITSNQLSNPLPYPDHFLSFSIIRRLFDEPWRMSINHPFPTWADDDDREKAREHFLKLKGAHQLIEVLINTYDEIDQNPSYNLSKKMFSYLIFQRTKEILNDKDSKLTDDPNAFEEQINDLYQQWITHRLKGLNFHPLYQLREKFCNLLTQVEYRHLRTIEKSRPQVLQFIYDRFKDKVELLDKEASLPESAPLIYNQALKNMKHYSQNIQFIDQFLKLDSHWKAFTCNPQQPLEQIISPEIQKTLYRKFHPYKLSVDASHGTHVAGIIAKHDPRLSIYPIRIGLGQRLVPKEEELFFTVFALKFSKWVKENPYILRSLRIDLPHLFQLDDSLSNQNLTDTILAYFKEHIQRDKSDKCIINNLKEIEHFTKAIKKTSQLKIKVANISIGLNPQLPSTKETPINENSQNIFYKRDVLYYYFIEYYKYQLRKAIVKDAPQTLFFIAAGNEGSWYDSYSHMSIPCELSSPYFERHLEAGEKIPFQDLSNTICVGSINRKGEVSPFTNLPLNLKSPFILAEGEAILSTIPEESCYGVEQELKSLLGNTPSYPQTVMGSDDDKKVTPFGKKMALKQIIQLGDPSYNNFLYQLDNEEKDNLILKTAKQFDQSTTFYEGLIESSRFQHCLQKKDMMARYSGTSMATPLAAAYTGSLILDMMEKRHIKNYKDIYNHSDFSPQEIWKQLVKKLPIGPQKYPLIFENTNRN